MKDKKTRDRLLTEVELEIMHAVWDLNFATVKEVVTYLSHSRKLAYTTVATVMKILESKDFLSCRKDAFAHTFLPLVSKSEYESTCIEHVLDNVFDGEPVALIQRLLEANKLDSQDIQLIEATLKKLENSSRRKK